MKKAFEFLNTHPVPFYVATIENGQPRVRPLSFVMEQNEELYFTTGKQKEIFEQMKKNPFVEICSTVNDKTEWLRIRGEVVFEEDIELKKKAFEVMPILKKAYQTPDSDQMVMFRIKNPQYKIFSF